MAWKIERWLAEVFPGEEQVYLEYRNLPPRELVIVSAAVLDSALAELLSLRLMDLPKEAEPFLGVDGDGRAPVGSFGARIQAALLVGIIVPEDAALLRQIKSLRNLFAHRARVDFVHPSAVKITQELCRLWIKRSAALFNQSEEFIGTTLQEIKDNLSKDEAAGIGLLLAIFSVYQAYFHRMHGRIERLGNALSKPDSVLN
ncbi:hypothetical protein [Devosia sp. CN2-171]|uniref:hypothetical protein n=1 Tax=Devosia sp. CN2-171 TaxID=3400909 RepID=UPI003BF80F52